MDAELNDAELEQAMRDGLERRAQRADVAAPVADRARTDVRRRRAGRVTAGLAAAAVVAVTTTTLALSRDDEMGSEPPASGPPVASDTDSGAEGVWRTEYWRDLQVEVPDSWGWGAAPTSSNGDLVVCGEPIYDGSPDGQGYVGRPLMLSDVCSMASDVPASQPYVWLGSEVDPGTRELGNGFVEETVEVNGSRLTVATDDEALRERILESATGGETCISELDLADPTLPRTVPGDVWRDAQVLNVCVYQDPDSPRGQQAELAYATTRDLGDLHAYLRALEEGEAPRDQCPTLDYAEGEWVVLEIGTEDGEVIRRDVVHLFCPGIDVGTDSLRGLETVRLTRAMVEPWAVEGIRAVVYGPSMGDLSEFGGLFIGPQG